jgi:hypothetical protein
MTARTTAVTAARTRDHRVLPDFVIGSPGETLGSESAAAGSTPV